MARRWTLLPTLGLALAFALACSSVAGDGSTDEDAAARVPKKGKKDARKGRAKTGGKPPPVSDGDVVIQVRPDGSFEPAAVTVKKGAKVTWALSDPYRQSIAPLEGDGGSDPCGSVAKYTGGDDDITGPMPRNPSGLFVLNQDGPGLTAAGKPNPSGPLGAVTDGSWASDRNVGAFLRLRWNWVQPDGEGKYDWTVLDREVEKAVANGKLYSIGVKAGFHGTPDWIFDAGVDKLTFREFGSHEGTEACKCGAFFELGNPTDERYQELYFDMLDAMAEHLKSNAAWYRHLAYVKPSGANLYSAENRLPKRCTCTKQCPGAANECVVKKEFKDAPGLDSSGRICNTKVWAEAGYTPKGLLSFYERQLEHMADGFPEKDFAYLLIHDGFPRVASPSKYLKCGDGKDVKGVPPPVVQTREILKQSWNTYGERFTIQHAGLRDKKPINNMLLKDRKPTQFIALQTTNDVTNADLLERVVSHGMDQSNDVMFLEVYEEGAIDADRKGGGADLNKKLHQRRKKAAAGQGPRRDPFPKQHSHTFDAAGTVHFVNPSSCSTNTPATGVVYVEK